MITREGTEMTERKLTDRSNKKSQSPEGSIRKSPRRYKRSPKRRVEKKKLMRDLASFETFNMEAWNSQLLERTFRSAREFLEKSKPKRAIMSIEQDCKLGGAIIGKKTVK